MRATVTSKGQITLPKKLRDALGIAAGTTLDFRVAGDDRIEAQVVEDDPLAIAGLLERPGRKPVSLADMEKAVTAVVRRRDRCAAS